MILFGGGMFLLGLAVSAQAGHNELNIKWTQATVTAAAINNTNLGLGGL
jgi:hypothetical protein